MLRRCWLLLGLSSGSPLLSELSAAQLRRLLEVTQKVSAEELSLATPPPSQEYGKFDPSVEKPDFDAVRASVEEELSALNVDEVSKRILDIIQSLSKVSIKGFEKPTTVDDKDDDQTSSEKRRLLNAFDLYGHQLGGNILSAVPATATSSWGNPWAAGAYNPYAPSLYAPSSAAAAAYGGGYGGGGATPYGGATSISDPWGVLRPMAYQAAPTAYYAPPMVPGLGMIPYRGLTAPQNALGMMMPPSLYAEFARGGMPTSDPSGGGGEAVGRPATGGSPPTAEGLPQLPDIQSMISTMTADMGNTLGERVGSTLGTSLAADLNLINGVANSAAANFRTLINGTQYGIYPPNNAFQGIPKRRLLDNNTLPLAAAPDQLLLSALQRLTGVDTAAAAAAPSPDTARATPTATAPDPVSLEGLLASLLTPSSISSTTTATATNGTSSTDVLGGSSPLSVDFIPTLAPLDSITADSVASVWNNAIESLTNTSQQLSLPTLDGYNATLPEISSIGNGAGLAEINDIVGQNLGTSLGSTMGNIASGTTSLINSYIQGAKEAFLSAFSPNLASLFKNEAVSQRRLAAVAHKRQLDASTPSCALSKTLYRSADSMSFNNVDSLTVCQMICQTYSDAGVYFGNCASPLSASDRQCVGASFSEITGRCSIFFSIEDQFTIEGYASVPLHCDDSTFVQTQSRVDAITTNTKCSQQIDWNIIRTVADSASPAAPSALAVTAFPELPAFTNQEVANTNIWHYNPDTPVTSTDGKFEDNVIYQVGYGVSNTDGYWGQSTNITDWRYCAWLCTQQTLCTHWTYFFNPNTYATSRGGCTLATNTEPAASAVSNVQTISGPRMTQLPVDLFGSYGNTGRRLYVADPDQKKWVAAANPPKRRLDSPYLSTIVDPKIMSKYGLRQLEGEAEVAAETVSAAATDVQPCEDSGFAYRSLYSSSATAERLADTVTSFVARTPEACAAACKEATGCAAWQYLPEYTISSDSRLQESQLTTCALLSSVTSAKVPSVPQMISGLNVAGTCTAKDKPQMLSTVSAVKVAATPTSITASSTAAPNSNATAAAAAAGTPSSTVVDGVANVTTCFDEDGHENHFANGVSIRGRLLSEGENVVRDVESPEKCRQACETASNCTVFSWGQWQGCYLMETVEAFVADTNGMVYSGYKDCRDNARNEGRRLEDAAAAAEEVEDRSVVTCERAQRGVIYSDGTILSQTENQYEDADSCWAACRAHQDCFYMTYITNEGSNVCVFFSDVEDTAEVATSVATSAESNCDVLGDIDFQGGWWRSVSKSARSKTGAAVGGTIGGAFVVVLAVMGGREYSKRRKGKAVEGKSVVRTTFLADLTPSVDGEGEAVVASQEGEGGRAASPSGRVKRKRNMFGMASPGALERGSPTLHVDDFEKVEPKSTGKRLRRYF